MAHLSDEIVGSILAADTRYLCEQSQSTESRGFSPSAPVFSHRKG